MEMEIEQNEASGKMDKGLIKKFKKHKNHINRLQKRIIMEQKGIAITPQSSTNEIWKTSREVLRPGNQVVTQMKIVKDGVEIVNMTLWKKSKLTRVKYRKSQKIQVLPL